MVKRFDYNVTDLESSYGVETGFFFSTEAIVDIELSNDISSDWNYEKGEIGVFGAIYQDTISIFVCEGLNDKEFFKNEIINFLDKINGKIYSFGQEFESGAIKGFFGVDLSEKFAEIKPFKGKGWNRDKFYQWLVEQDITPNVTDIYDGDVKKPLQDYQKYVNNRDLNALTNLQSHNLNDLLKEAVILKHRDKFFESFIINDRGFMEKEKREE